MKIHEIILLLTAQVLNRDAGHDDDDSDSEDEDDDDSPDGKQAPVSKEAIEARFHRYKKNWPHIVRGREDSEGSSAVTAARDQAAEQGGCGGCGL